MNNEKLVEGVMRARAYQLEDKLTLAAEAGAKARRDGNPMDCPKMYRPQVGDSHLYDAYVMGYRGAEIADGGKAS